MTDTNIPPSVQEILDFYVRFNFRRFSYKDLADQLKLKIDTVIQRIRRNNEYFEIDDSQRPSRISIKKGLKEVYFYRDKNKCQICQKTVSPEMLSMRFRNPYQEEKFEWKNVLSVCDECKDKEIVKTVKRVKQAGLIEYKEISIRGNSRRIPNTDSYEWYYEFDELDGSGSFPLIDENGKIASTTIAPILNYFSADGWEVLDIEKFWGTEYESEEYQVFFKQKKKEE